ncbi:phosphatidylserine decarboxylase-domain-containing protein [Hyaloraphidium curvatum]|nr:phosphatidylserine decarboxylase-domain-containing protein [Hyaloraphidium curvatum]
MASPPPAGPGAAGAGGPLPEPPRPARVVTLTDVDAGETVLAPPATPDTELPPYSAAPAAGEASSGVARLRVWEALAADSDDDSLGSRGSRSPSPDTLSRPADQSSDRGDHLSSPRDGSQSRSASPGPFSRAEQAARMGLSGLSLEPRKALSEAWTLPASFDEKKVQPPRTPTAPPRTGSASPVFSSKPGRNLKGGELYGTLKIEIVSVTDLPVRRRSTLTKALLLNQKPERRWTPFVVVSYGASTYKTKVRAQLPVPYGSDTASVVFNANMPDVAVLRSQLHWDVVFSLWDSQAIGTNKAIGTSLSVEVEDLVDPVQRDGGGYWETSRQAPPERRSFDDVQRPVTPPSMPDDGVPVARAKSWTNLDVFDGSQADIDPPSPTSRTTADLNLMIPYPTTDEVPLAMPGPSAGNGKRKGWLRSRRTRSRSASPSPAKSSGQTSGGSDQESDRADRKAFRRPMSPLFRRSGSFTPPASPAIPGLRFPVMREKKLLVEQPPIVDSDGRVEELPPITLNIRYGFSPRFHLIRNFILTVLHNIRARQLATGSPIGAPNQMIDPTAPITHISIVDVLLINAERLGGWFADEDLDAIFVGRDEITVDEFVERWDARDWESREAELPPRPPSPGPKSKAAGKEKEGNGNGSASAAPGTPAPEDAFAELACFICEQPFPPADPTSALPYSVQQLNHLLVCASRDYSAAATSMLKRREFLTESAAARGLYTSLLARLGLGTYRVGKHEGFILVQNRETGQLEEEYIPSYVRLGIQLLYRSRVSRSIVETNTIAGLFRNTTAGHGARYDDPRSASGIAKFIRTYRINVDEVEKPVAEYRTLNEFFTRRLRAGARKLDAPGDPGVLVSMADCRLTCFASVNEATQVWIKGSGFTITRLLGGDAAMGKEFADSTVVIFRLAPCDYHRFHSPVDGKVVGFVPVKSPGLYYTVNPMAVRSPVDVFGDNVREICYVDTGPDRFGLVAIVAIGAMLVGSIVWTVKEGQELKRMDEMGMFKFGGSTVVMLIQKGIAQLDEDLLANSAKALETVVQVGNRIGELVHGNGGDWEEQGDAGAG